jgi:hypothetical protein
LAQNFHWRKSTAIAGEKTTKKLIKTRVYNIAPTILFIGAKLAQKSLRQYENENRL